MGAGRDPRERGVAGPALQQAAANDASPVVRSLAAAALTRLVPLSSTNTKSEEATSGKRGIVSAPLVSVSDTVAESPHAYLASEGRASRHGTAEGSRTVGRVRLGAVGCVLLLAAGCLTKEPPQKHFYDQHIQPIFNSFCVGNTSPCHSIDPGDGHRAGQPGSVLVRGVQKRRDVLRTYGSYPQPLLLLKAMPEDVGA